MREIESRAVEGVVADGGSVGLEAAVESSVSQMPWLTGADEAAVRLARMYASRIDQGAREFESGVISSTDYNKVLYLGPHLLNTLRALGGSPDGRSAAKSDSSPGGVLDELRAKRSRKAAGGS